ncbi:MAG: hypothetical protein J6X02_04030 [Bacilli bacterium]|nr:hypothetical protein [Bacilli bacterium]
MKYYIDFDNTIFDTVSFYDDLLKILYDGGITKEYIDNYYQEKGMDPLKLIYSIKDLDVQNKALNHFNDTNKYLYQDAIDFLNSKKDSEFILYTNGYLEYQIKKIVNSKILKHFKNVIISESDKTKLDIDYTKGIFIDDNVDVLKSLLLKNAKKVYRVKRNNNRHSDSIYNDEKIIEINNMKEIKD